MGWLLMVSPIFNLLDCEILPKRKEIFDKYCKIIRWGRANPTRFIEDFFKLQLTDMQKYVLMSSWIPANIVWLMGRNSRKSYLVTPFMMARALLLPNTNTYIMAPSRRQAQGTFTKLEDLAKGNIASVIGVSSVFLDECVRMNSTADPFTHAKQSYSVELYNGSTINTLNSVIKNIVGIRSNFSEKTLTFIEICQKNNFFNCWKILKLNKLQHSFERSKCECDESRKNCLDGSRLNPKNYVNR